MTSDKCECDLNDVYKMAALSICEMATAALTCGAGRGGG